MSHAQPRTAGPQAKPQPLRQATLADVLRAGSITPHFQPLVNLRNQRVWGLEALARGVDPISGQAIPPQRLFALARAPEETIALDRLCRAKALEAFAELHRGHPELVLSLNFESALLDMGVVGSGHLLAQVEAAGIDPSAVVIEIVESKVGDLEALERFAQTYRAHGFLLALDDVGTGHSNLERIAAIKPDVIKLDRSLIGGLDQEYYKQEVTRALVNLAGNIGALAVAEGVETRGEALAALELGVEILQGYHFARPQPDLDEHQACSGRIKAVAVAFRRYVIEKIAAKKEQHRQYAEVMAQLVGCIEGLAQEEFDPTLCQLLALHPSLECIYVLDDEGIQVSRTFCNPGRVIDQRKHIFQPSPQGADQSLKNYYLLLKAGLERYVSEPYISRASGNPCITLSTWFHDDQGRDCIFCADFDAQLIAGLTP